MRVKYKLSGILIAVALLLLKTHRVSAQVDPHFSQYYVYPLGLNPGMTGAMDGDYRASAIYRNQWSSVMTPFSTMGFSADVTTRKNINLGLNIFNQTAGDGGYHFLNGYLTVAYSGIKLDGEGYSRLAIGVQAGFLNRRFDPSKLRFGDQWAAGIGYNPNLSTGEVFNQTSLSSFDAGAGIAYYDASPDKKLNAFAGFSAFHLTQPDDFFLGAEKARLPVRFAIHAGLRINMENGLSIIPNALYMLQGSAQEKMTGLYAQKQLNEEADFLFGANWRWNDAVAPFVGFYYKNLTVGLSYDVTVSDLSKNGSNTNSFEISFSYTGKRTRQNLDYFKCPRL